MLTEHFSLSRSAYLPRRFHSVLWETGVIRDNHALFALDTYSQARGFSQEGNIEDSAEQDVLDLLEILATAKHFAPEVLGIQNVPESVSHVLASWKLLEEENPLVIDALPEKSLELFAKVKLIENDPDKYRDERSPAKFCQKLLEWQRAVKFRHSLASGRILDDSAEQSAIIEDYRELIDIPPPSYLANTTSLDYEIAKEVQYIAFMINHHKKDIAWYVDYTAKTPAEDLTAENIFDYGDWKLLPYLSHPFRKAFEYCLDVCDDNPHEATHLFAGRSLNTLALYAAFAEKRPPAAISFSLFAPFIKDDANLRKSLLESSEDSFKTMVELSSPELFPQHAPEMDPALLCAFHDVSCIAAANNLYYKSLLLFSTKVVVPRIPTEIIQFGQEILSTEMLPCHSSELSFYRKKITDNARKVYSSHGSGDYSLDLPPLPPSRFASRTSLTDAPTSNLVDLTTFRSSKNPGAAPS